jgi:hypothetical protein
MQIDSGLMGVEETLKATAAFINKVEAAIPDVLEYILREMCNYVKQYGPWTDQTSNLRNSISVNMDTMREWPADTPAATIAALVSQNETPLIKVEGDGYTGAISAGMEYAIWVETKEGYWVLQGAIDHFEPLIAKYFADRMSVDKLDLEEAANIAYLNYQTNKQFGR